MQKVVSINVDNDTLSGTLFFPEKLQKKNPAVLFLHGWQSTERRYLARAEALAEIGYICLTFTRRDYQEKTGQYKSLGPSDHLKDTIATYDFLASQNGVDQQKISVVGASYGAYLASLLSAKRTVYSLVLRVPALYPDEEFTKQKAPSFKKEDYEKLSITVHNNMALDAIAQFHGHVCIIESENDEVIPHDTIEKYKKALKNKENLTYTLMREATHSLLGSPENVWQKEFTRLLISWFKDLK